jgi:hypothetical protein
MPYLGGNRFNARILLNGVCPGVYHLRYKILKYINTCSNNIRAVCESASWKASILKDCNIFHPKEEHGFRAFGNKMFTRVFGPKKGRIGM